VPDRGDHPDLRARAGGLGAAAPSNRLTHRNPEPPASKRLTSSAPAGTARSVAHRPRRQGGRTRRSVALKGVRWALWRNLEDLTEDQGHTLAFIQITNNSLYRAYLLN
jgi:hypothetical protein